MEKSPLIQKTTDYEQFEMYSYNRKINKNSFQRLLKNIEKENLLYAHPILVNSKFFVVDGQHRLEVAKRLGVPIYYIQSDAFSKRHIMGANTNQSTWNVTDVVRYLAYGEDNEACKEILSLMEELELRPRGFFGLILGFQNNRLMEQIKDGLFFLPENRELMNKAIELYKEVKCFIDERKIRPLSMIVCFSFTKALRILVANKSFDKEIFFKKLENKWFILKPQQNAKEWYKLFIEIYNWRNKDGLEESE